MNKLFKAIRTWWRKISFDHNGAMYVHSMSGKFYVVYPDGNKSINMSWRCANNYREIFGGEVKEVD